MRFDGLPDPAVATGNVGLIVAPGLPRPVADSERKRVDMTSGPIARRVGRLAWPLVLGNLLQTVYNLADLFWVGRVGREPVAAVSLMFPLSWMFVSAAMGVTAATIALVSQHVGAGDDVVGAAVVAGADVLGHQGDGGGRDAHRRGDEHPGQREH